MTEQEPQLDISPLINAVARLREGVERHHRDEVYDRMPFQDLIRTGNEQGLLRSDWPAWRGFRDMRARTSHTYWSTVAQRVAAGIPEFLAEAAYLSDQLRQHLQ